MREGMKKGMGFILMLFVFFFLLPSSAYAADNLAYRYDGVVYGPSYIVTSLSTSDYNSRQWIIVNAPDKFSAAVYAVGGNPVDLDSTKKALLSNASTGGDFYSFSGQFVNLGGSFDIPSWMGGAEKTIYRTFAGMYDEDNLYVAAFTPAQRYGASSDYGVIAGGGSVGGGGGSGTLSGSGYEIGTLEQINDTTIHAKLGYNYNANGQQVTYGGNTYTVFNNVDAYNASTAANKLYIKYIDYTLTSATNYTTQSQGRGDTFTVFANADGVGRLYCYYKDQFNFDVRNNNNLEYVYGFKNVTDERHGVYYFIIRSNSIVFDRIEGDTVYLRATTGVDNNSGINSGGSYGASGIYLASSLSVSSEPDVPDTNWPDDENVAPTQPDIPEPQEPVIDEQPTQPTPEPTPTYPTYTTVLVNNFTADIQGILDAMDEHCGHLQEALWWNFNNFWQRLSTKLTNDFNTLRTFLSQQFSWIVSSVDAMVESLKDYLEDLAEWLRDELDYSISGSAYDDNTLMSWLRKIYYKLGNGNVSTKPVDPNANPDGVGDWISQLLANLFTALDDLAGGLLTSLATLLGGLVTKFPFSIPWDVAAILGLLVAEPVAPSLEFPVYTLSAGELVQVGTMDIDMDAWTPYLTGIHMMIRASFILFLMLRTKDFMTIMEKAVGLDA